MPDSVDPVISVPFKIGGLDNVATAGSCFAQHIARTLVANGFRYLVTELGGSDNGYGVFPARFGNIYTTRQLLQLFNAAYGLQDANAVWIRTSDSAFVDGFRPLVEPQGFATRAALVENRRVHLAAVREMFERCNIFIFTLGLTEAWRSAKTGLVVPLAPGVVGVPETGEEHEFINLSVSAMTEDLVHFIDKLRVVNPSVRMILTVSPVPLIATFERRHVLVSTIYSKSALRVVAEEVTHLRDQIAYFPSYEIITGHHHGNRFFEPDLRSVSNEGVDHVMSIFTRHYLNNSGDPELAPIKLHRPETAGEISDLYEVVCDEEAIAE